MADQKKIHIINKKASFEYQLHTKYNAGIVLSGTEVKSIRDGNAISVTHFVLLNKKVIKQNCI
jgi:SsrA-binding protein